MTLPTLERFEWEKSPYAVLKGDEITLNSQKPKNYIGPRYIPFDYHLEIINNLKNVFSGEDALTFVKEWGFLKHHDFNKLYKIDSAGSLEEVESAPVSDILDLSKRLRNYSYIYYFHSLYSKAKNGDEDYNSIEFKVNEWIASNPDILPFNDEVLKNTLKVNYEHKDLEKHLSFNEYLLDVAVQFGRANTSMELHNGAFLQIDQETGQPAFHFDTLYHFINYMFFAGSYAQPNLCQDPKCNKLFYPSRNNQQYCPPLAWEKRSRCEQRHSKELRRKEQKKTQEKQT